MSYGKSLAASLNHREFPAFSATDAEACALLKPPTSKGPRPMAKTSNSPSILPTALIPRDSITVDPIRNARTNLEGIEELANNIHANGLLQPPVVEKLSSGGYILVAGFRRMAALDKLSIAEIPCVVRAETNDADTAVVNLAENIARQDLSTHDIAAALTHLRSKHNMTANEIARRLQTGGGSALSVSSINNLVRIYTTLAAASDIREEWKRQHSSATIPNLLAIVKPEKGNPPDGAQMRARWEALTSLEGDGEEPEETESSASDAPKGPKKRSAVAITKMMTLVTESEGDAESKRLTLAALKWVLGNQKTLLGLSLEKAA